jgi:hypothetical protein
MFDEAVAELTSIHIPEFDSIVLTSTSQDLTIRAECYRTHPVRMPGEGVTELTCIHIPQFDTSIIKGGYIEIMVNDWSYLRTLPDNGYRFFVKNSLHQQGASAHPTSFQIKSQKSKVLNSLLGDGGQSLPSPTRLIK